MPNPPPRTSITRPSPPPNARRGFNPFARLSRTASRAASPSAPRPGAALARRAGGAIASGARSAGGFVRAKTRYVFNATKEPAKAALLRGTTELGGHGTAYLLDRVFQWRAWGGWMRPSFFLGAGAFVVAALTGGKWRVMFANTGTGVVHHYAARSFDMINKLLSGDDAPSGTAGADDDTGATSRRKTSTAY